MKKLSLQSRLVLPAVLTAIALVVTLGLAGYALRDAVASLALIYEGNVVPITHLQRMDATLKEVRFRIAGVLLGQIAQVGARNHAKEAREALPRAWAAFRQSADVAGMSEVNGKRVEAVEKELPRLAALLGRLEEAYALPEMKELEPRLQGILEEDWPVLHSKFVKPLGEMIQAQEAAAHERYETSRARAMRLGVIVLAIALAGMALVFCAGVWLARSLLRQIGGEPDYVAEMARAIGNGDLSMTVVTRRGDSTSMLCSMKHTVGQLSDIIARIKLAAESIGGASGEIARGNADLSTRTEEQASSLEETASSMEELTSTVKQNAESAKRANQLAAGASTVAAKGGQVVGEVVSTMNAISGSSRKIADIIGVIDGIAFQTNILALNAAVEAARAGEQGRGFAVVATEVRSLAQRSAAAAKEIKELISDSVAKVDSGSKLVNDAGKTMEEVVAAVKLVTDIMGEITAASQAQSGGIEQVNQAIAQMDNVTQQNAALVEEAAAAAEAMKEQAQSLIATVAVFKLEDGVWGPAPAARPVDEGTLEQPANASVRTERRSARRAANVARLPATRTPGAAVEAAKPARSKVSGSDITGQE